jgi:hypothetical protein
MLLKFRGFIRYICYLTILDSCKSHCSSDAVSSSSPLEEINVKKACLVVLRPGCRFWEQSCLINEGRAPVVYVCNIVCVCVYVNPPSPCLCVTGQNVHLVIWRCWFHIEIARDIDVIKDGKLWRCGLDRISLGCIPLAGFYVHGSGSARYVWLPDVRLPPRSRWDLRTFGRITEHTVAITYRRCGTTYRSHPQGSRWDS